MVHAVYRYWAETHSQTHYPRLIHFSETFFESMFELTVTGILPQRSKNATHTEKLIHLLLYKSEHQFRISTMKTKMELRKVIQIFGTKQL